MEKKSPNLRHDISKLALNCRIKANASSFLAKKHLESPRLNQVRYKQLITQAKNHSTYLWMLQLDGVGKAKLLHSLADAYLLNAEVLDTLHDLLVSANCRGTLLIRMLSVLAESQCLLRTVVAKLVVARDLEQGEIHRIVTELASKWQIYIHRYLRAEDDVEPTGLIKLKKEQRRISDFVAKQDRIRRTTKKALEDKNATIKSKTTIAPTLGMSILLIGREEDSLIRRIEAELGVKLDVAFSKKVESYRRFVNRATSDKYTHIVVADLTSITDVGKLAAICKLHKKAFLTLGGKLTVSRLRNALEGTAAKRAAHLIAA